MRNFDADAPDRHSERVCQSEQRPDYAKQKKDSPQSLDKKEDKSPQHKPQYKKKKVAALSIKNASKFENIDEEQDLDSEIARQRGRSHDMSPESERSSGCNSN
ncbi:hypothetical protein NDU88_005006 [Pleurodeles waltl]|uniref:Uncharacterized protein n=1 Tax=Pleurodeles waltl TaxID=8319 RepID=A0AAV7T9R1_PLEWA|nr:hypothetical protein NDU88_005006 [Pleurodeles waltl]